MLITVLLGLASVAVVGAVCVAWEFTAPRRAIVREQRGRIRAWRAGLARVDSRDVDAIPRTGGPKGGDA